MSSAVDSSAPSRDKLQAVARYQRHVILALLGNIAIAILSFLIMAQVIFGLFLGFLGVAVAAPVAALLIVLTKMLYLQDVLNDESAKLLKEDPQAHFAASEEAAIN